MTFNKLLIVSAFILAFSNSFAQEVIIDTEPAKETVITLDAPASIPTYTPIQSQIQPSKPRSNLSADDKKALNLIGNTKGSIPPFRAQDGSVRFTYGASHVTIVCATLQVCDLQLQAGELVNNLHLGDNVRWSVEPAITGYGANQIMHLVIKPLDSGLSTNMLITTNRRTYNINLKSTNKEFMPAISFAYPDEINANVLAAQKISQTEMANNTTVYGDNVSGLDFNYRISGSAPWKPVRVYNNGLKTYIELPKTALTGEIPTLLGLTKSGGIFSNDEYYMVNYRLQNNRFEVDALFDQAALVIGVGRSQSKVIITREKP